MINKLPTDAYALLVVSAVLSVLSASVYIWKNYSRDKTTAVLDRAIQRLLVKVLVIYGFIVEVSYVIIFPVAKITRCILFHLILVLLANMAYLFYFYEKMDPKIEKQKDDERKERDGHYTVDVGAKDIALSWLDSEIFEKIDHRQNRINDNTIYMQHIGRYLTYVGWNILFKFILGVILWMVSMATICTFAKPYFIPYILVPNGIVLFILFCVDIRSFSLARTSLELE